ncbi:hypothetical protein [Alteromonas sp. H39]|uniref:hypothetical protein n=1 Tax=Alteromonas sp. H39 TaxID=3389876 RepID=UPI0039E0465F
MKPEQLNHSYTPTALREINHKIAALCDNPSATDVESLNALLKIRDELIVSHLESLSPEDKKIFATKEIRVNDIMKEVAQTLLKSAKDDASHFVRSQVAIKKYK